MNNTSLTLGDELHRLCECRDAHMRYSPAWYKLTWKILVVKQQIEALARKAHP